MSVTTIPGIVFDEETITPRKLNLWARPIFEISDESIGAAEIEYTDSVDGDFRRYVAIDTSDPTDTATHKHLRVGESNVPFVTAYISVSADLSIHPVDLKIGQVMIVCVQNTSGTRRTITLQLGPDDTDVIRYVNGTPAVDPNDYSVIRIVRVVTLGGGIAINTSYQEGYA